MAGIANPFMLEVTSAGLTTSITAYTSADQLGTEITCSPSGAGNNSFVVVTAMAIVDYAKVTGAVDARLFYNSTTPAADNAAASWSDADENKLVPGGQISFPAPTVDANNSTVAIPNLWIGPFQLTGVSFYLDLITRSANAVFAAAGDLHVKLGGYYFS